MKSNIPSEDKYDLAMSFDEVLGLELGLPNYGLMETDEIKSLREKRDILRKNGKYLEADNIRKQVEKMGFDILDTPEGSIIKSAK